ncbi:PREDICTED: uncharacterized protein LOC104774002 [Camelina sativa]|uniref:Uncharacterized protein LOC104774002 n=1 Tax=Camelina sativa TaxID=90675 RepID=A0ABM1RH60_CAMSA|nr:PREDICTED: uncharacterized protein LOC104774002 [Camelina sativa]
MVMKRTLMIELDMMTITAVMRTLMSIEEDEEEEEERQPPKEELEYLELREKMKETMWKNLRKGSANAQSSQERRRKLPYKDFGSFFGPSQPVISSRVIQESKSLLENELRTAKMSNSSQMVCAIDLCSS